MKAAEQLVGVKLDGGWTVKERLAQQPSSGGTFSIPYLVENADGETHFLKAFDFSDAFAAADVLKALASLVNVFEHERDILDVCKGRRMSNVVTAVTYGTVALPGMSAPEGTVYYLIFELATSDVRSQVDTKKRLDPLTCAKILNDISLGLWQVHRVGIAHQDGKPSNVLIYGDGKHKLADFGRASRQGRAVWFDNKDVAGDYTYAPPEQLYSYIHGDYVVRRVGCDMYLLGNLAAFLFSGINITEAIFARLDPQFHPGTWGGTYENVLPMLMNAFDDVMQDMAKEIDPRVKDDVLKVVHELCNPDLKERGHPRGVGKHDQYSLQRYKSYFDLMVKRTAIAMRTSNAA